jgi:hypothetical protein
VSSRREPAIPLTRCAREHYSRSCVFRLSAQQVRSLRNKADHRDYPQLKAKSNARAFVIAPSCSTTRSLPRGTPEPRDASCLESGVPRLGHLRAQALCIRQQPTSSFFAKALTESHQFLQALDMQNIRFQWLFTTKTHCRGAGGSGENRERSGSGTWSAQI